MTVNKLGHADLEGMTAEGGTLVNVTQVTIERMGQDEFAITFLGRKNSLLLTLRSEGPIESSLTYEWNLDAVKDTRFEIAPAESVGQYYVLDQLTPYQAFLGTREECENFINEQTKRLPYNTSEPIPA